MFSQESFPSRSRRTLLKYEATWGAPSQVESRRKFPLFAHAETESGGTRKNYRFNPNTSCIE